MGNEEILKLAINRALNNDLDWIGWSEIINVEQLNDRLFDFKMKDKALCMEYHGIIFNHDFAKAFWGNEEILKLAINRALNNDLDWIGWSEIINVEQLNDRLFDFKMKDKALCMEYHGIIFNHDFAKAFWGNEETCPYCGGNEVDDGNEFGIVCCAECGDISGVCTYPWQYHLQQMVIKENPIQYLEQFLDNPKGLTV